MDADKKEIRKQIKKAFEYRHCLIYNGGLITLFDKDDKAFFEIEYFTKEQRKVLENYLLKYIDSKKNK